MGRHERGDVVADLYAGIEGARSGNLLGGRCFGYPDVLRKELDIGEGLTLLAGLAIGWPEEGNKVNSVLAGREEFEKHVVWTED